MTGERMTGEAAVRGQLSLGGMPVRLYPCTPTRLTTWTDCPRRYRFTYLDRPRPPKGPPWAHNSMGAAVHTALAGWWSLPLPGRTSHAAADLLRRSWLPQGFADDAQSLTWRERSARSVGNYAAGLDPADEPVGVERTVATRTATLAVSGRIDRLDARGEGLVVVDYKTGRRVPEPQDARTSLALALYAVAASRTLRRACRRVELHHLPSRSVVVAEHDEASLERKLGEAESIAMDARAADAAHREGRGGDEVFPARPGRLCSWCDFRTHCPQGSAAAPRLESWAALEL